MRICGIDPGRHGALAFADLVDDQLLNARVVDMPVISDALGEHRPDARAVHEIVSKERPELIVLEHVQPRPGRGSVSEWGFARGFGSLVAALQIGCDPRVHLVRPSIWKEAMCLTLGKTATTAQKKDASLTLARAIFHLLGTTHLKRAKDDGRAEALLLLEYFRVHLSRLPEIEVI